MNIISLFVVGTFVGNAAYFSRTKPVHGNILSYLNYDKCDRVWATNFKFSCRMFKRFGGTI